MEIMRFKTLIKADHKLGGNEYVKGRITGMAYVICNVHGKIPHGIKRCDDGVIFLVECTKEEYERFIDITNDCYPDLCVFYYEESK